MMNPYTHPRIILVETLKRLYDYGMTTTSGGNLSIKDDEGNIWITPSGIDKGTLRPEDVIKVAPGGECTGPHKPSCELPFHRSVYRLRPDVRAVLHAHAPALVAFSMVGRIPNANLVPGIAEKCGKVAFAKYEIPGSEKLGNIIAAEFAKGADSVIMENHGAVMCGKTIAQAFARFEALDFAARMEIHASAVAPVHPLNAAASPVNWEEFTPSSLLPEECELRAKLAEFSARCYRQRLLFSGAAVLSARIRPGTDDFLITPAEFDPLNLSMDELVRIQNGKVQNGKVPSLTAPVCRAIYQAHPDVNAVLMTRPPYFMAYAAGGTELDSRTIPESYIQLRDIPFLTAKEYCSAPDAAAKRISPDKPVLMIENCGLLTTGATLINAFDRLEVGEFTAKCLVLARQIGTFKPIDQAQVNEIIEVFNLPK